MQWDWSCRANEDSMGSPAIIRESFAYYHQLRLFINIRKIQLDLIQNSTIRIIVDVHTEIYNNLLIVNMINKVKLTSCSVLITNIHRRSYIWFATFQNQSFCFVREGSTIQIILQLRLFYKDVPLNVMPEIINQIQFLL